MAYMCQLMRFWYLPVLRLQRAKAQLSRVLAFCTYEIWITFRIHLYDIRLQMAKAQLSQLVGIVAFCVHEVWMTFGIHFYGKCS